MTNRDTMHKISVALTTFILVFIFGVMCGYSLGKSDDANQAQQPTRPTESVINQ